MGKIRKTIQSGNFGIGAKRNQQIRVGNLKKEKKFHFRKELYQGGETKLKVPPRFTRTKTGKYGETKVSSVDDHGVSWQENDSPPDAQTVQALRGELKGK